MEGIGSGGRRHRKNTEGLQNSGEECRGCLRGTDVPVEARGKSDWKKEAPQGCGDRVREKRERRKEKKKKSGTTILCATSHTR